MGVSNCCLLHSSLALPALSDVAIRGGDFKVRLFGSNSGSTIYCLYALGKLLNLSIPQLFYMLNRCNNLYHRVVVRIK